MLRSAVSLAVAALIIGVCSASAQTTAAPAAKFFDKAQVAQALKAGGLIYDGKFFRAQISQRSEPGQVELHQKDTDVFYIVSGSATIVTGGTMVGGKPAGPGEIRGTSITGGESRSVAAGDVVVIPDNLNHWWKEVHQPLFYFVVKEVTGK
jgi:glc operon protein GlcG